MLSSCIRMFLIMDTPPYTNKDFFPQNNVTVGTEFRATSETKGELAKKVSFFQCSLFSVFCGILFYFFSHLCFL